MEVLSIELKRKGVKYGMNEVLSIEVMSDEKKKEVWDDESIGWWDDLSMKRVE